MKPDGLPDLLWVRIPGPATVQTSGRFPNFTGLRLGNGARLDLEANFNEDWPENAVPLEIADFELAAYPVTVAQFRSFVEQGGYREDSYWSEVGRQWRDSKNWIAPWYWDDPTWTLANHPVVGVSWYEAEAYCNWLNEQLHLPPGTIRLPTETEWEWVVRGPEGRRYPWGDAWETWRCNGEDSGINRTSAVGSFPGGVGGWWQAIWPTEAALYDLAGNVWEWTASDYSEDYVSANESVLNTNRDSRRVLRGGAWYDGPQRLRSAARSRYYPNDRNLGRGFRLART